MKLRYVLLFLAATASMQAAGVGGIGAFQFVTALNNLSAGFQAMVQAAGTIMMIASGFALWHVRTDMSELAKGLLSVALLAGIVLGPLNFLTSLGVAGAVI